MKKLQLQLQVVEDNLIPKKQQQTLVRPEKEQGKLANISVCDNIKTIEAG